MSKERLAALKSYQALPQDLRNAVKLHLLHGIDGPEACSLVGRANSERDWNREKVQKAVADYRTDQPDPEDWEALVESIKTPDSALGATQAPNTPSTEGRQPINDPTETSLNATVQTKDLNIEQVVNTKGQTCQECGQPAGSTYDSRLLCPPCFSRALGFKPKFNEPPAVPAEDRCPKCHCVLCACHRQGPSSSEVILGGALPANARDLFPNITYETAQFWREQADAEEDERRRLTALLASREEPRF